MIDLPANRASIKALIWFVVAAGAVLYCRHYWDEAPGVTLYVEAAQCMLYGLPLQNCNPTFTYPPIFALMMIPLVPLPMVLQNLVWYAVTLGALVLCFTLSARLVRRLVGDQWSERDLAWLYGLGILLSLNFLFAAIANQSYDALVVLLVLGGLAGLAADKPACGGASLACAAALKATPLLFLPYLLVKRHYRAAAVMTGVFAGACILPDLAFTVGRRAGQSSYFMAWLGQVAGPALTEKLSGNPHTFWFASNPNNNSLRGLIGAFVDENGAQFKFVLYSVDAVYAAVVAALMLRTGNGRPALAIDGALLLISMLMLSPMTSPSHYVALILPMFAVAAMWRKGDATMRKVAGFFVFANLVLQNATSRDLVGAAVTLWAKEHKLLVTDALLLLVFFAGVSFRTRPSRAPTDAPSAIGRSAGPIQGEA
jgi:hypothetical protein